MIMRSLAESFAEYGLISFYFCKSGASSFRDLKRRFVRGKRLYITDHGTRTSMIGISYEGKSVLSVSNLGVDTFDVR